jgi:DNA-binding transcriptional MerR regulator
VNDCSRSARYLAGVTEATPDEMTIDELARRAGTLTSTVRMYQARALLQKPARSGRNAHYGPHHLERLRLIERLQGQGFSLAGIKQLLDAWEAGGSLPDALGLRAEEQPLVVTPGELAARLPGIELDPETMRRALAAGLVEVLDDGRLRVPDRRFLTVGPALAEMGVSVDRILDEWIALRELTDTIAARFAAVAEDELLPTVAGKGDAAADAARDALTQLVPLAHTVVDAALAASLRDLLARLTADQPPAGSRSQVQPER